MTPDNFVLNYWMFNHWRFTFVCLLQSFSSQRWRRNFFPFHASLPVVKMKFYWTIWITESRCDLFPIMVSDCDYQYIKMLVAEHSKILILITCFGLNLLNSRYMAAWGIQASYLWGTRCAFNTQVLCVRKIFTWISVWSLMHINFRRWKWSSLTSFQQTHTRMLL